jgi:hypothetical protein
MFTSQPNKGLSAFKIQLPFNPSAGKSDSMLVYGVIVVPAEYKKAQHLGSHRLAHIRSVGTGWTNGGNVSQLAGIKKLQLRWAKSTEIDERSTCRFSLRGDHWPDPFFGTDGKRRVHTGPSALHGAEERTE